MNPIQPIPAAGTTPIANTDTRFECLPGNADSQGGSVPPPKPSLRADKLQQAGGSGRVRQNDLNNRLSANEKEKNANLANPENVSALEQKYLRTRAIHEKRYGPTKATEVTKATNATKAYIAACEKRITDFNTEFNQIPEFLTSNAILFLVADKIAQGEVDYGIADFLFKREKEDLEKKLAKTIHHDKDDDGSGGKVCNSLDNFSFSYDAMQAAVIYGNLPLLDMALNSLAVQHDLAPSKLGKGSIMDSLYLALSKANEDTAKCIMKHFDINHVHNDFYLDGGTRVSKGIIHTLIRERNLAGLELAFKLNADVNLEEPQGRVVKGSTAVKSWANTPSKLAEETGDQAIISLVERAIAERNLPNN